jgi:hypothetical protein
VAAEVRDQPFNRVSEYSVTSEFDDFPDRYNRKRPYPVSLRFLLPLVGQGELWFAEMITKRAAMPVSMLTLVSSQSILVGLS